MIPTSDLARLRAKTAKSPEDFRVLAQAQGLTDPDSLGQWLQSEFGLAGDYARRIVQLLRQVDGGAPLPPHDPDGSSGFLPLLPQRHAAD